MQTLPGYLIVFAGAGLGGMLRHAVNLTVYRAAGFDTMAATFLVNVLGSIVMGLLAGQFALRASPNHELQLFLTTGILGGFTTFSAFSLEAALLWERHQFMTLAFYATGSVTLSIVGVFAGLAIMRAA